MRGRRTLRVTGRTETKERTPKHLLTSPSPILHLSLLNSLPTLTRRKPSVSTPTQTILVQEAHHTTRTAARTGHRIELTLVLRIVPMHNLPLLTLIAIVHYLKPLWMQTSNLDLHITVTTTTRYARALLLIVRSKQLHPRTRHLRPTLLPHTAAIPLLVILLQHIAQTATIAVRTLASPRIPTCTPPTTLILLLHHTTAIPMILSNPITSMQHPLNHTILTLRTNLSIQHLSLMHPLMRPNGRNDTSRDPIDTSIRPHLFNLPNLSLSLLLRWTHPRLLYAFVAS